MAYLVLITYFTMASYLVFASAGRIALMFNAGMDLDPLPFTSAGLGVIALVILGVAWDQWNPNK